MLMYAPNQYCADCGARLWLYGDFEEVTSTRVHDFWEGQCSNCGYENSCAHGETREEVWYECWDSTIVDENTHRLYGIEGIDVYCALCGDWLEYRENKCEGRDVPHRMWGSRCDDCGYTIDCAHEQTSFVTEPESIRANLPLLSIIIQSEFAVFKKWILSAVVDFWCV